ncbi:interferon-induced 35 kDa protein isoform X1 [Apteryx rowi]|uniref:interferon-induced 35 kDa protein isoform X1 n=2 Tax=Apteryx rowi TaxID=308060 RepID=UPI000E1D43C5|nr:interferon-induced 35 kDa protein isoform X1 [Apteryx rowi]XP_025927093.1 interferon-induced 35 kDa protein isoform X1 [Apteryx rowi]
MDLKEESFIQLSMPAEAENSLLEMTPERVRQEIERYKELCSALEQDCVELQTAKEAAEQRTRELWKEGEYFHKHLEQQMSVSRVCVASCQETIHLAKEERSRLRQEKQMLEKRLEQVKRRGLAEDLATLLPSLPERKMVFKGQVTDKEDVSTLTLTPLIHYPLPGGSALITFEKPEVAQRIMELKEHVVELSHGEELDKCRVQVRAEPVELLLPSALEISLSRSCRRILVSGLPSLGIPEETLLDKLELFFSKTKNGGGEVETLEFLDDTSQVMLSFVQDGVAEQLIARGCVQFPIRKAKYEIKISPYVSGDITSLQLRPSRCARTVLLSGIPDVLDEELTRDALEIHFQKSSRGGGEVDALSYVPEGRQAVAVFREDVG